jgi:hypothetical protein
MLAFAQISRMDAISKLSRKSPSAIFPIRACEEHLRKGDKSRLQYSNGAVCFLAWAKRLFKATNSRNRKTAELEKNGIAIWDSVPCRLRSPVFFRVKLWLGCRLEPVAFVGYPPTRVGDRNGGKHRPPKRQRQIRHQAQSRKRQPKNLLLHDSILAGMCAGEIVSRAAIPYLYIPGAPRWPNSSASFEESGGYQRFSLSCVPARPSARTADRRPCGRRRVAWKRCEAWDHRSR